MHTSRLPAQWVWSCSVPPPSSVGVVMFCDCPTSDGADFLSELLTQHILDRATGTARTPPLSHSHLHQVHTPHPSHSSHLPSSSSLQLLASVSGVAVALSPACQQLLRAFYLASRRVRASSLHGTDMPVNALDVMSVELLSITTSLTHTHSHSHSLTLTLTLTHTHIPQEWSSRGTCSAQPAE